MTDFNVHPFNDSHTISIDEAVVKLLKLDSIIKISTDAHDERGYRTLREAMHDIQQGVIYEYENVQEELDSHGGEFGIDNPEYQQLKQDLDDIEHDVHVWQKYNERAGDCAIKVKAAVFGKKSELVIDHYESEFYKSPRIVESSMAGWAKKVLKIDLEERQEIILKSDQQTTRPKGQERTLLITIYKLSYLLAEAVQLCYCMKPNLTEQKKSGNYVAMLSVDGTLNKSELLRYIEKKFGKQANQSVRTLRRQLSSALKSVANSNEVDLDELGKIILGLDESINDDDKKKLLPRLFPVVEKSLKEN
jgi:hypothetical protein